MESKYWNIHEILPFQRYFNFINGPRSIGKSYTCQKWLLKEAIMKQKATVYITRNEYEQKMGGVEAAFDKVIRNEYPQGKWKVTQTQIWYEDILCVQGLSLSQAQKIKKMSFPYVHYILFDEYQIEEGTGKYINGYNEPELFVNIYHTIDREEQRVKCFLLGNNTSFYNPYHLYPLFGIPKDPEVIRKAGIWKNELSLFQMAGISDELQAEKESNPFLRRLSGTRYGDYANQGIYRDDSYTSLARLGPNARYMVTLRVEGQDYGLYNNQDYAQVTVADSVDPTCRDKYALVKAEAREGYQYLKTDFKFMADMLRKYFKMNCVSYTNMAVKTKVEPVIMKIM